MLSLLLDIQPALGMREPFSALSHGLGAVVAAVATVLLVREARSNGETGRSVAVFGATVVLVFAASALFHTVTVPPDRLDLYGRVDHTAIFLVIAGTGTAIYSMLETRWSDQLLAATWGLTILGIAAKLTIDSLGGWETAAMHLTVGWVCSIGIFAIAFSDHWRRLQSFVAGALFFTIGAIVFATDWPVVWPGIVEGHEVFHVLVLAGEAFHFYFVYHYCTCPTAFCEPPLDIAGDAAASGVGVDAGGR
jgi:hemolysin III